MYILKAILRRLAPGPNPVGDFSNPTIDKGLPGRPDGGKLSSPHGSWCTAKRCILRRECCLGPRPPGPLVVLLTHTCIPSQATSICSPLYLWGPEAEAFPGGEWERKHEDSTFLYSTRYSVTFPLLRLSLLPPLPPSPVVTRSIRWQESFGKGSLASETIFCVCADLANLQ